MRINSSPGKVPTTRVYHPPADPSLTTQVFHKVVHQRRERHLWRRERNMQSLRNADAPSDPCLVNTAILSGFPAATNNFWNVCSISAEGMPAVIASPSSLEYQLSISKPLSTIFVNFPTHPYSGHLQLISDIDLQLSFSPRESDAKTSNWI